MCWVSRMFSVCLLTACCAGSGGCTHPPTLVDDVDKACGGPIWRDKDGMIATVTVKHAGGPVFSGEVVYHVYSRQMVIQRLFDGALEQIGYDDGAIWTRAVPISDRGIWTRTLFFASYFPAAFDLSRSKTEVRELAPMMLGGQRYRIGLVSKHSGNDQWIICVRRSDHIPQALIPLAPTVNPSHRHDPRGMPPVTKGFAVLFEDVLHVEGLAVPGKWSVWNWDSRDGVQGEPVAVVTLSDVTFGAIDPSATPKTTWDVSTEGGRWWR